MTLTEKKTNGREMHDIFLIIQKMRQYYFRQTRLAEYKEINQSCKMKSHSGHQLHHHSSELRLEQSGPKSNKRYLSSRKSFSSFRKYRKKESQLLCGVFCTT
jgi:hypothetical protein